MRRKCWVETSGPAPCGQEGTVPPWAVAIDRDRNRYAPAVPAMSAAIRMKTDTNTMIASGRHWFGTTNGSCHEEHKEDGSADQDHFGQKPAGTRWRLGGVHVRLGLPRIDDPFRAGDFARR